MAIAPGMPMIDMDQLRMDIDLLRKKVGHLDERGFKDHAELYLQLLRKAESYLKMFEARIKNG